VRNNLFVTSGTVNLSCARNVVVGDKSKVQKMVQMAWTFINDRSAVYFLLLKDPDAVCVTKAYITVAIQLRYDYDTTIARCIRL